MAYCASFFFFFHFSQRKMGDRRDLFRWEMNHTNFWETSVAAVVYDIMIHCAKTSEWFFLILLQSQRIIISAPTWETKKVS